MKRLALAWAALRGKGKNVAELPARVTVVTQDGTGCGHVTRVRCNSILVCEDGEVQVRLCLSLFEVMK